MEIFLNPIIRSKYTEIDFLEESGTMLINIEWSLQRTIFVALRFPDPEFAFLLSMQDGDLMFQRNGNISIHKAQEHSGKTVWVGFLWTPESIKTFFRPDKDPNSIVSYEIPTSFTLPPSDLIIYAKVNNRIPKKGYSSKEDFSYHVIKAIQLSQIEMDQTSSYSNFWNVFKESRKIIKRVPRDETDIHNSIHSLIFNYCLKNGINIIREYHTSIGNIDFVFHTQINGKLYQIPCEVKKAESKDLKHGYTIQLPKYMKQLGVSTGIFLVIGFSGGDWLEGENLTKTLVKLDNPIIENGIRVIGLDVSKPSQASKK
jgi:hypothetical protein